MQPKFEHDCADCVFLGPYIEGINTRYDLYFCMQGGHIPTVIARWSNKGPDYYSGLGFNLIPLQVAERRAVSRGLLKRDGNQLVAI